MAGDTVRTDVRAVKLTVSAPGIVWVLDGEELPHSTNQTVPEFLQDQFATEPRFLRVPGYGANAGLLLGLYDQVSTGMHGGLEVCSPTLCGGAAEQSDVQLYTARACRSAASVGGWHKFGPVDAKSYGLWAYATGAKTWDDTEVLALLDTHPAYRALKFVTGLEWRSAALLIGHILDPRYFVDPTDPDAPPSRLFQFLGLDQKTQAEHPSQSVRSARYGAVVGAWEGTGEVADPTKLLPGQFVWRSYHAKGTPEKGILAASRRLVDFLRQTWTAALCASGQGPRLFCPGLFFDDPEAALAYQKHLELV